MTRANASARSADVGDFVWVRARVTDSFPDECGVQIVVKGLVTKTWAGRSEIMFVEPRAQGWCPAVAAPPLGFGRVVDIIRERHVPRVSRGCERSKDRRHLGQTRGKEDHR